MTVSTEASSVCATPQLLQAILDGLPAMIGYWDRELRNRMANSAHAGWFGLTPEEMRGEHIRDLLGPRMYEENLPHMQAALAGERRHFERTIPDREGVTRHLQATYIPDEREGEIHGFFVLVNDVTEAVEAERRVKSVDRTLHSIATAVARNAPLGEVAGLVVESMHELFALRNASVVRFEPGSRASILKIKPELPFVGESIELRTGEPSAAAEVLATGEAAVVEFGPEGEGPAAKAHRAGLRVGAAAPVHVGGSLWGAVVMTAGENARLGDDLLERLTSFAELVGIAIANAEAWNALEERASTDPITGLPNARRFGEQLGREMAMAARAGSPLSLAMIDIDGFKAVNDAFGHPAGDRVLAEIAELIQRNARGYEFVARLGGDEFAWVLSGADAYQARAACERVREAVAAASLKDAGPLTISIGIASLRTGEDEDALRRRADAALYTAKREGRNMTVVGVS